MRSNCLLFALLLFWRQWRRRRLYFVIRPSDAGPFPHFLVGRWSNDAQAVRVVSRKPHKYGSKVDAPLLCHKGGAVFGDPAPKT